MLNRLLLCVRNDVSLVGINQRSSVSVPMRLAFAALVLIVAGCSSSAEEDTLLRYRATTAKSFDEALADLEVAVSEQNFVIVARHHIGRALRDNGRPDYPEITVLHVCNIDYAGKILDVSQDYVLHLPCRMAVYEAGGRVVVEARLFPDDDPELRPIARQINTALKEIVRFAAD